MLGSSSSMYDDSTVKLHRLPATETAEPSPRSEKALAHAALTSRERVFRTCGECIRRRMHQTKCRPLDLFLNARAADPANRSDELTVFGFESLITSCGMTEDKLEVGSMLSQAKDASSGSSTLRAAKASAKRRTKHARRKRIVQLFQDFGAKGLQNGGSLSFSMLKRQLRKDANPIQNNLNQLSKEKVRHFKSMKRRKIRRLRQSRINQFPLKVLGEAPHVVLDSSLGDSIFNPNSSAFQGDEDLAFESDQKKRPSTSPLNGGGSALPSMVFHQDYSRPYSSLSSSSLSQTRLLSEMHKDSDSFLPFVRLAAASARASLARNTSDPRIDDPSGHAAYQTYDDGEGSGQKHISNYPEPEVDSQESLSDEQYTDLEKTTEHPLDPYLSLKSQENLEAKPWFHPEQAQSIARQMEIDLILGSPSPAFDPSVPFTPERPSTYGGRSTGPISMADFKANPVHQISDQRGIIARAIESRFSAAVLLELKQKVQNSVESTHCRSENKSSDKEGGTSNEALSEVNTPRKLSRLLTVRNHASGHDASIQNHPMQLTIRPPTWSTSVPRSELIATEAQLRRSSQIMERVFDECLIAGCVEAVKNLTLFHDNVEKVKRKVAKACAQQIYYSGVGGIYDSYDDDDDEFQDEDGINRNGNQNSNKSVKAHRFTQADIWRALRSKDPSQVRQNGLRGLPESLNMDVCSIFVLSMLKVHQDGTLMLQPENKTVFEEKENGSTLPPPRPEQSIVAKETVADSDVENRELIMDERLCDPKQEITEALHNLEDMENKNSTIIKDAASEYFLDRKAEREEQHEYQCDEYAEERSQTEQDVKDESNHKCAIDEHEEEHKNEHEDEGKHKYKDEDETQQTNYQDEVQQFATDQRSSENRAFAAGSDASIKAQDEPREENKHMIESHYDPMVGNNNIEHINPEQKPRANMELKDDDPETPQLYPTKLLNSNEDTESVPPTNAQHLVYESENSPPPPLNNDDEKQDQSLENEEESYKNTESESKPPSFQENEKSQEDGSTDSVKVHYVHRSKVISPVQQREIDNLRKQMEEEEEALFESEILAYRKKAIQEQIKRNRRKLRRCGSQISSNMNPLQVLGIENDNDGFISSRPSSRGSSRPTSAASSHSSRPSSAASSRSRPSSRYGSRNKKPLLRIIKPVSNEDKKKKEDSEKQKKLIRLPADLHYCTVLSGPKNKANGVSERYAIDIRKARRAREYNTRRKAKDVPNDEDSAGKMDHTFLSISLRTSDGKCFQFLDLDILDFVGEKEYQQSELLSLASAYEIRCFLDKLVLKLDFSAIYQDNETMLVRDYDANEVIEATSKKSDIQLGSSSHIITNQGKVRLALKPNIRQKVRRTLADQEAAAIKLQCLARRTEAEATVKKYRKEIQQQIEVSSDAALSIQNMFRKWCAWKKYVEMSRPIIEEDATIRIQAAWRKYYIQTRMQVFGESADLDMRSDLEVWEELKSHCATLIQALIAGFLVRGRRKRGAPPSAWHRSKVDISDESYDRFPSPRLLNDFDFFISPDSENDEQNFVM